MVGYDDGPLTAVTRPPLTTVRQEVSSKGETAVARLLSLMGGGRAADAPLPTTLVVRDSTAPPSS